MIKTVLNSMIRTALSNRFLVWLFLILALAACGRQAEYADLVLQNGTIVTLDEMVPQAEALAIKGDRILAVGNSDGIRPYIGAGTQVIDLEGKLVIPGFIEGHGHFLSLGQSKMRLELSAAKTWDEILDHVKLAVAEAGPGEWIIGRGWHQDKWTAPPRPNVEGLPTDDELSRISPDNPVWLTHASGHLAVVNAKTMALAGITAATPDPEGGQIVRDERGRPTGVLRETAIDPIDSVWQIKQWARTPEEVEDDYRQEMILATEECLSKGITGFHDAGVSFATIDFYRRMAEEGKLGLRLYAMIAENNDSLRQRLAQYRIDGAANNFLTVRSIKGQIDGALGSHGAWLLEPYADMPESYGLNTDSLPSLRETARLAIANGFQFCVHAIGDRGNREILNIYEAVMAEHPDRKDIRWRVEHAQHLNPDDIPRFGKLGVIAAMQGVHCTSDGPWVPKRIGDLRAEEGAYVWRKLLQSGAVMVNGTDTPVEPVDPIAGFYSTVTRRMNDGRQFYPDQCLTREEALKTYTINAAYASFEENIKGSLTTGKLADITVLSQNILTCSESEIMATEVIYTIVGGKIMYRQRN